MFEDEREEPAAGAAAGRPGRGAGRSRRAAPGPFDGGWDGPGPEGWLVWSPADEAAQARGFCCAEDAESNEPCRHMRHFAAVMAAQDRVARVRAAAEGELWDEDALDDGGDPAGDDPHARVRVRVWLVASQVLADAARAAGVARTSEITGDVAVAPGEVEETAARLARAAEAATLARGEEITPDVQEFFQVAAAMAPREPLADADRTVVLSAEQVAAGVELFLAVARGETDVVVPDDPGPAPVTEAPYSPWEAAGAAGDGCLLTTIGLDTDSLARCPAGPELAALLSGVNLQDLDGFAAVEALAAIRRVESWAAAKSAELADVVATRCRDIYDARAVKGPGGTVLDGSAQEVAMRLGISVTEANRLIRTGRGMRGAFTDTAAALRSGAIDYRKASTIITTLAEHALPVAVLAEAEVLPTAPTRTHAQLVKDLAAALVKVDPAAATERHHRARAGRKVTHPSPLPHGMASLYAVLPAEDAVRVDLALEAMTTTAKAHGDDRTRDQLRADALAVLAHGALTTGWAGPPPGTKPPTLGQQIDDDPTDAAHATGDHADTADDSPGTADDSPGTADDAGAADEARATDAADDAGLPGPGVEPGVEDRAAFTAGAPPDPGPPGEPPHPGPPSTADDPTGPPAPGPGPLPPEVPPDVEDPAPPPGAPPGRLRPGTGDWVECPGTGEIPDLHLLLSWRSGMPLGDPGTNRTQIRVTIPLSVALPPDDETPTGTNGGDDTASVTAGSVGTTAGGDDDTGATAGTSAADTAGTAGTDDGDRAADAGTQIDATTGTGGGVPADAAVAGRDLDLDPIPGEVAELAGYGPISPDVARALAAGGTWRRLVTDPLSGTVLDVGRTRYRPPADLAEHVRTRDRTCVRPGCTTPAERCQIDHTLAFSQGGKTAAASLGAQCTTDHALKSAGTFKTTQPSPGVFEWLTPTGHAYRRNLDGTTTPLNTWRGRGRPSLTGAHGSHGDDEYGEPPF
ncbi:HNH endonuclease [Georgenia sp. TF02-10]|uniref:HNH endonuclease signature motif containing protein n=1 Tax=Georgenia sp. TF02-10 TaxID=2917725 RepID=UPI001FA7A51B|nr:HNH endonuclease signature motif containing protein [Georgenia sp. TF02-10]UNX53993.1 HNH endonuclease [Georgenia sp. TF02-10]